MLFKANSSSFTHDESHSYLFYPSESYSTIIQHKNSYSNNHLLNTLFMKIMDNSFGNSELSLRLPNLILLIVYMVYAFLILKEFPPWLLLSGFLLLITNNYLIDFFGLARGYGLSFGFMLMSLFHLFKSIEKNSVFHIVLFHTSAALATLGSFTLLIYYGAAIITYSLLIFLYSKRIFRVKVIATNAIMLGLMFLFLKNPVQNVLGTNKLDFGGKGSFYSDTLHHLIQNSIHGMLIEGFAGHLLKISLILFLMIGCVYLILNILKKREGINISDRLVVIQTLFSGILLLIIISHIILEVDYPISRFSLFLLPLFIILVIYWVDYLRALFHVRIPRTIMVTLSIFSLIGFIFKLNNKAYREWAFDQNTKTMMIALKKDVQSNEEVKPQTLASYWIYSPTAKYYKKKLNLTHLEIIDYRNLNKDKTADYYYLNNDQILEDKDLIKIKEFENTKSLLMKHK